jgi:hypothetical protein
MSAFEELKTLDSKLSELEIKCFNLQGRIETMTLKELTFYVRSDGNISIISNNLLIQVGAFLTDTRESSEVSFLEKQVLVRKMLYVRELAIKTNIAILDRQIKENYSLRRFSTWKRILSRVFLPRKYNN